MGPSNNYTCDCNLNWDQCKWPNCANSQTRLETNSATNSGCVCGYQVCIWPNCGVNKNYNFQKNTSIPIVLKIVRAT